MKRSKHNLSYSKLMSFKMGELVPCGLLEVLPGDSIQLQTRALVRFAPLLTPPMRPVRVRIHHFFVPHRLCWTGWENFITGGPDGNDASVHPYVSNAVSAGEPYDYYGCPVGTASGQMRVSAFPGRGYNLIWNEYYRDQDLQTARVVSLASGGDTTTTKLMALVCWEKDPFTSARPWEQKGPVVTIPLGGSAVLTGAATVREANATTGAIVQLERGGSGLGAPVQVNQAGGAAGTDLFVDLTSGGASISGAGITVNSLRQSLAIQRFEEARAMYGSRYPEYLRAIGVRSSDARLQRPEYLGGGRQTVQFSEVLQTGTDVTTPVGTMRGHGISALRANRFRRFFEEHGYIHSFISIVPKTIYSNGMARHFMKETKFDYWQRELENIGQQTLWVNQVYSVPGGSWKTVFGYEPRYNEYRRMESQVAGEFRTPALNFWHFAREFASAPTLNSSFVACVPPERAFAATTTDNIYCQVHHSVQARRLVSQTHIPRTF